MNIVIMKYPVGYKCSFFNKNENDEVLSVHYWVRSYAIGVRKKYVVERIIRFNEQYDYSKTLKPAKFRCNDVIECTEKEFKDKIKYCNNWKRYIGV